MLRESLIDAAERLLSERQAGTLTTREIARAAGVSDGVLYNYFADKNELVVTALVRQYVRLIDRFDTGLPQPGEATIEENLLVYARHALDAHLGGLPIAMTLLPAPDLLRRLVDELHSRPGGPQLFAHRFIEYVEGEQRGGRLPPHVDVHAATTLFVGSTMMLALTSLMGGAPGDPYDQLEGIVTTLLHGIVH